MNRQVARSIFKILLVSIYVLSLAPMQTAKVAQAQEGADLYVKDTPLDTGVEPNPDTGPMWVSEDIWVRTTPDPNYQPYPFPEASPTWAPSPHENPEYRDPLYSAPNYVYVRVRNAGNAPSTGSERLRLYWAKASTGLAWPAQWVDYLQGGAGLTVLYGAEVTKPRLNAANASQAERDAYIQAVLDIGNAPLLFPGGVSYWHKQNGIHNLASVLASGHGTPAFLPWHREMMNRYELLLQKANPTVKLLYWDWTTDPEDASGAVGFNIFTPDFMGQSGRNTGGVSIGAPFNPPAGTTLAPPNVSRNLDASTTPPAQPDATVLGNSAYPAFRTTLEQSPNHNSAHGYVGGNGQLSNATTAAQDPFFFLLHTNVDRLWAQWQRDLASASNLARLSPATAYGTSAGNPNITQSMPPWNGTGSLRPWIAADGQIVTKNSLNQSVVSPPIYDTAPLLIPVLQPGEAVVMEIPWYAPNPADFAAFGGDQGHFCLLARIETSIAAPFGMTTPEGTDVFANTRNNNNIAWKNITVVDNFPGALRATSILVRNVFEEPVRAGLRFANTNAFGESFFDFGTITVDLKPELFERWRAGGGEGQGIEPVGGTRIQIASPEAFIGNLELGPGETFSIDIAFELFQDTPLPRGVTPKWDLIQIGTPEDPEGIVGGQRFEIDFSKLVLVQEGSEWRYLDDGTTPDDNWRFADYDDARWSAGRAPLGFGTDIATTISGGPPDLRHTTTYFRKTFEVTDPGFVHSLYLRIRRNDGAVVYLNGAEIYRSNLPQLEVTPKTPAVRDVAGLEGKAFYPIKVDSDLLQEGSNTIAAEIHLASPSSQDLAFDLELYANPTDAGSVPNIAFASPANGALFQVGQAVPIQVDALDTDGRVRSVSLFAGEELIGTGTSAPFTFLWKSAPLGSHLLRAVALDSSGLQGTVDTTITVLENTPPVVELVQPDGGTIFYEGEAVPLFAHASDEGGKIERVEFYVSSMDVFADPELAGAVDTAPYETSLTGLPTGHYMVSAVAIDDGGASSQSLPAMFMVLAGSHDH
jgi:hypothetical protein